MTSQQFLACDSSTLANFKAWAQAISSWFATCGWVQASDTGQVNWSTIAAVPGSSAFIFEIWKPGDGLANFYVKVEYGNKGIAAAPAIQVSMGSATNGAGTLQGFVTMVHQCETQNLSSGGLTLHECNFSGDSGQIAVMMWRATGVNGAPQSFAIQRSLNSSGTRTGDYATIWAQGHNSGPTPPYGSQQTLHFTLGVAPPLKSKQQAANTSGWGVLAGNFTDNANTSAFNAGIPFCNCVPFVGKWDFPCTVVGVAWGPDIVDGIPFTITNQYGQTKTYMPTKFGGAAQVTSACGVGTTSTAMCMEYD